MVSDAIAITLLGVTGLCAIYAIGFAGVILAQ